MNKKEKKKKERNRNMVKAPGSGTTKSSVYW
jgi:hypothetical protein